MEPLHTRLCVAQLGGDLRATGRRASHKGPRSVLGAAPAGARAGPKATPLPEHAVPQTGVCGTRARLQLDEGGGGAGGGRLLQGGRHGVPDPGLCPGPTVGVADGPGAPVSTHAEKGSNDTDVLSVGTRIHYGSMWDSRSSNLRTSWQSLILKAPHVTHYYAPHRSAHEPTTVTHTSLTGGRAQRRWKRATRAWVSRSFCGRTPRRDAAGSWAPRCTRRC